MVNAANQQPETRLKRVVEDMTMTWLGLRIIECRDLAALKLLPILTGQQL
jgi:hypothetical protein